MALSNPNNFGTPGGFDPERVARAQADYADILRPASFEIEARALGRLAVVRTAFVEIGASDPVLVTERRLQTGLFWKRRSNSFEVTKQEAGSSEEGTYLQTNFRYLPYRDVLIVFRSLHQADDTDATAEEHVRRHYLQELASGISAGTEADWEEFSALTESLKDGLVTPVSSAEIELRHKAGEF